MKLLFNFANNVSMENNNRSSTNPTETNGATDNKNSFVIDKSVFTK